MTTGGFLTRALAIVAGVVLGMVVVAGAGSWPLRHRKPEFAPSPPASVPHERAPDTRA